MPLRISLKAGERLIVGGAVVRNGGHRCELMIENDVPILRGKEVLGLDETTSPCRRIYFTVQLMYVDPANLEAHQALYDELMADVLGASPSMIPLLAELSDRIQEQEYYQALKVARRLIAYEQDLISHAVVRS